MGVRTDCRKHVLPLVRRSISNPAKFFAHFLIFPAKVCRDMGATREAVDKNEPGMQVHPVGAGKMDMESLVKRGCVPCISRRAGWLDQRQNDSGADRLHGNFPDGGGSCGRPLFPDACLAFCSLLGDGMPGDLR